jgi:hypothetical protein
MSEEFSEAEMQNIYDNAKDPTSTKGRLKDPEIEKFVRTFGEEHRTLIIESLNWLSEEEPTWGLAKPINKTAFLKDLVRRVAKP